MRSSETRNPIQGFAVREIVTAAAGAPFYVSADTGIIGIRISAASEYYINSDSVNKASMPAGVTIIDGHTESYTFTADTVLEVMKA